MSTLDVLVGLNLVNAGLQCTNQYISDKKNDNPYAINRLMFNLSGSLARIGTADMMARHGNYWGYTLNSFVPYTNPVANTFALGGMMPLVPGVSYGCAPYVSPMPFGGFMPPHHHHCGPGYRSTFISFRC